MLSMHLECLKCQKFSGGFALYGQRIGTRLTTSVMPEDLVRPYLSLTGATSKAGVVVLSIGVNYPVVILYGGEAGWARRYHGN